jgi:hemerythrin
MSRYWRSSFCSLDPQVDADHRALFRLLDQVATHRRESDAGELNQLLDRLLEYTFDHFAREERAMRAYGYPQGSRHTQEHQAMRKAFIESLRRVVKGDMALPAFIKHLRESFTYHFETDDMRFVTWQRQHQGQATGTPVGLAAAP